MTHAEAISVFIRAGIVLAIYAVAVLSARWWNKRRVHPYDQYGRAMKKLGQRPCPGTGLRRVGGRCPFCQQPVSAVKDYEHDEFVVANHLPGESYR